jgi:hypothetical protein
MMSGGSGREGSSPRSSKKEQQRAVEEGIAIVRNAIKQLLAEPKAERDAHLETLGAGLNTLADRLGAVDEQGRARRVLATRKIVQLVKKASDAKP